MESKSETMKAERKHVSAERLWNALRFPAEMFLLVSATVAALACDYWALGYIEIPAQSRCGLESIVWIFIWIASGISLALKFLLARFFKYAKLYPDVGILLTLAVYAAAIASAKNDETIRQAAECAVYVCFAAEIATAVFFAIKTETAREIAKD